MKFKDRLSGATSPRPPDPALYGQWVAIGESPDRWTTLGGLPLVEGDALCPGLADDWVIAREGEPAPVRGRVFPSALPDPQDVAAVREIGGRLRADPGAGWLTWSGVSPIAQGLDLTLERHPLEDHIEREYPHLLQVCRKPRKHIRVETERVPVSRARRVSPSAPAWLASHTEDWDHRKIAGIHPRQVLAEVREEQWDVYENRVAARLVDHLVLWLRRRIFEVRRILREILDRVDQSAVSRGQSRHRIDRICRLWGGSMDDASRGRQDAQRAIDLLEGLLYRILALMDSPLYRNVPQRTSVPLALRMTNVLCNDDDYRGIARLWNAWSDMARPRDLSPRQRHELHQEFHRDFIAWCALVVVRALDQVGIQPADDGQMEAAFRPGCEVRLNGGLTLRWDTLGRLCVLDGTAERVRFVPIPQSLEQAPSGEAVQARIAQLIDGAKGQKAWTVVLHPAAPGTAPHKVVATISNPPAPGVDGAIDFVRVSPFLIDSVERVARAVRWAVTVPRMLSYPPRLRALPEFTSEETGPFRSAGAREVRLIRPLKDNEPLMKHVATELQKASDACAALEHQEKKIEAQLRRERGDRRAVAELNRRDHGLKQPLIEARERSDAMERFDRELHAARGALESLVRCPACGEAARFHAHDNDCFVARCPSNSCEAEWGLRHDPGSGTRIPYLVRGDVDTAAWQSADPVNRVDEVIGCDVLAIPVIEDGGQVAFVVPRRTPVGETSDERSTRGEPLT
jgi:hypothetical protein